MDEIYDIYHDESKELSYWHGFLFVPRSQKQNLLNLLQASRNGSKWQEFISFKDISKRMGPKSPRVQLIESWLTIALASLQQQKLLTLPTSFFVCDNPKKYFYRLDNLLGCKFVVFKEKDNHKKMFRGLSKLKKIELTLRMGIKGGIHKLFNEKTPIKIGNLIIEKFGPDQDRTLNNILKNFTQRLIKEKRNYVSFDEGAKIILQSGNHKKVKSTQSLDDSHLLQLCDVLLGGVRFHSYCADFDHIKYQISSPCKSLLERDQNNFFRMRESRFLNGFSLLESWLENGEWKFAPLKLTGNAYSLKLHQLILSLKY